MCPSTRAVWLQRKGLQECWCRQAGPPPCIASGHMWQLNRAASRCDCGDLDVFEEQVMNSAQTGELVTQQRRGAHLLAIFLKMRRMILPDRVLGRPATGHMPPPSQPLA